MMNTIIGAIGLFALTYLSVTELPRILDMFLG